MDKDGGAHPKVKRRKLDGDTPAVTIASADDLHYLLTSRQSSTSGTRIAVLQFKDFLNSIANSEHQEDRARKLRILGVYSEEQLPSGPQVAAFPDLISIWSFAVEINDERLLSSVPSVLALYLKIVSTQLQLRNIGLSLCKSLLLKDQLRLLDRGLTATKTKEHLISPCLRLLTEIVSFDGGEVAALIHSKKDTTFRRLEVFLGQRTQESDAPEDARQRPTLRRIAQRYLLANLKFQTASAKGEIIARGKILRACLQYLKHDQADIIRDVLVVLENDIVRTSSLTKGIKSRLFTYSNLSSLANLYTFHEPTATVYSSRSVRDQVDTLLRLICTQQDSGILLRQNGWYHAGSNPDKTLAVAADPTKIHPDLCPPSGSKHREKCPVRNGTISTFILGLKPELDRLQASLLLDVFRAAPELVADYFSKRSNFIPEPKDTPAWLGQSAFLFSVIQLPVPTYCGWEDTYTSLPPPSSTVIESILPRPLDRPNITRCLNLNHEVITLFAVRAVTVAFQKLKKVLDVYRDATSNLESWKQGSSDLLSAFSQRCPLAKDVLSTLQRTPKSDEQLRGSVIELIANYHQVLPHLIMLERFDTPLLLVDAIKRVGNDSEDQPLKSSRFSELENLMKIAQMSSDTNWWRKPGKFLSLKSLACVDTF
jgi:nucleolar pre-ribosomal-associated protein 1